MPPVKCEHGNIRGDLKDCLLCYLEASLRREQEINDNLALRLESSNLEGKLALVRAGRYLTALECESCIRCPEHGDPTTTALNASEQVGEDTDVSEI